MGIVGAQLFIDQDSQGVFPRCPRKSAVAALIQEVLSDPDLAHDDAWRRMLAASMQDLIDAEAAAVIGAAPYERTEQRTTLRNSKRIKTVDTTAGSIELAIPKLRSGSFFPSPLNPGRRVDKALYAVICSAWVEGVSTRKIDDLVKALVTSDAHMGIRTTRSRPSCPGRLGSTAGSTLPATSHTT